MYFESFVRHIYTHFKHRTTDWTAAFFSKEKTLSIEHERWNSENRWYDPSKAWAFCWQFSMKQQIKSCKFKSKAFERKHGNWLLLMTVVIIVIFLVYFVVHIQCNQVQMICSHTNYINSFFPIFFERVNKYDKILLRKKNPVYRTGQHKTHD